MLINLLIIRIVGTMYGGVGKKDMAGVSEKLGIG